MNITVSRLTEALGTVWAVVWLFTSVNSHVHLRGGEREREREEGGRVGWREEGREGEKQGGREGERLSTLDLFTLTYPKLTCGLNLYLNPVSKV